MKKVKVAVYGTTGKVVMLNTSANEGAQIGVDLLMPDGSVATLASLAAALNTGSSAGGTGAISHSTLAGLTLGDDHPQYVRKDTLTSDGDIYVRVGSVIARLPIGPTASVLTSRNGIPIWAPLPLIPGPPGEDGMEGDRGPPGERGLTGPAGTTGGPGIPGEDGMDGDHGPPGERGPIGVTGTTGASGPPGFPIPGEDGMDGDHGPPGERGPTGATGTTGSPGPPGFPIPGEDGMDGDHGPPGERGPTGATGVQGVPGLIGPPGDDGLDGDHGPPGERGPTGATGVSGARGDIGPPGDDGLDGDHGPPGERGPVGATGGVGAVGPVGPPGDDGLDGDHGPPGERGPVGTQGPVGPMGALLPGEDGMDGDHGPPGERGPTGTAGAAGTPGPPGPPGEDGMDGEPGPPGPPGTSGGGGSGANPTALVGLSAVNGTALTFLRSDGAPALDQSIAPTWTGNHIHSPVSGIGVVINLVTGQFGLKVAGDGNSQYMMQLNSTSATSGRNCINYLNSGAVTQNWAVGVDVGGSSSGDFAFRNITAGTVPLTIKASNGAVTIAAPNAAGVALSVNGIAGSTTLNILPADSASVGLRLLDPGANASDFRINSTNTGINIQALGTVSTLNITAKSGVVIGSPTVSGNITLDVSAGLAAASLRLAAGTATVQPMQLVSGVVLTTAVAGSVEFDGICKYFTPAASTRGVDLHEYVVCLSADYTLTSQTAAQKAFNSTTNGAVTLPIGTYEFECQVDVTGLSGAAQSLGFAFGGAATFTQRWRSIAYPNAGGTVASPQCTTNIAANTTLVSAATVNNVTAMIVGIIRVTVAGTVIPQVSMLQAVAAVVKDKSFCRFRPIGNGTVATVGNWS